MKQTLLVPELRELLSSNDVTTIRSFADEAHPAVVAELLSGLEAAEIWRVLHLLPVVERAEILAHFDLDQQVDLVTGENRRDVARLLEEMAPDERADLVQQLDEKVRDELLPLVARAEREDIRQLVSYEEGTAGSVMTTEYAALRPEVSIAQAIESLRQQAPNSETIYYIYVVDEAHRLVGFVSLRELILARPAQKVGDIMHTEIISVHVEDDQEEVARQIEKYDLLAIGVVNAGNVLVGIVTHDDAIDILRQEQQEDVEKMMGIAGRHEAGEYLKTPALVHFRNRAVWVVALAALGLVTLYIVGNFQPLFAQFAILVLFMPMLTGTGGNTGSQSATLVVRALALQEVSPKDALPILLKEFKVAALLGALLAIVAFGRVLLFGGGNDLFPPGFTLVHIGVAISAALGLTVVTSTLVGALLPLVAAKLKCDPALIASPALTTIVDIIGLLLYFTTAKVLLGI